MKTSAVLFSAGLALILKAPFAVAEVPGKVAAAWYAGWHGWEEDFPLSKVSWSKYTHMTYAFAETSPDVNSLNLIGDSPPNMLEDFVAEAHKNNVKALISVGGWTGSVYFSNAVATPENRTAFVKTVVDFVAKYELDGVDFDWEYPNSPGVGCNNPTSADTANFLLYLQELRADPAGAQMIVTAATATRPFNGPDGTPSTDVAAFAGFLDYVALMNYDLWGGWSPTVGPNGPLNDTCVAAPEAKVGSAVSAAQLWATAGIPLGQLVLAVPGYGRGFRVRKADAYEEGTTDLKPYAKFDASDRPVGDSWATRHADRPNPCGVVEPPASFYTFWSLIDEEGYLNEDGKTPAPGIGYRFDECSQTPYVYKEAEETMISFDNAQSFAAKGNFIKDMGLKGFAMWEAGGDYKDMLLDSIRSAAGIADSENAGSGTTQPPPEPSTEPITGNTPDCH